ncbi:MAG: 4Fe-4S ferredoxin [Candidatus Heimdallarchaeota archaeon]|nr:4Fe-4S ferredoxin [Candidatus Heimdallarchaeota archaeon]
MKIGLVYFSGTGNTKTIAKTIRNELNKLGSIVEEIDITPYNSRRQEISFENYDAMIFGFPIYGSCIPEIIIEWIEKLNEQEKQCAMFFTYGGPTIGVAHYHTKNLLEDQGFRVIATAEFLGKHSFNFGPGFNFLEDRPNEEDLSIAKEYAKKIHSLFEKENIRSIDLKKPPQFDEFIERRESRQKRKSTIVPTRNGEECSMCMKCQEECPTNAFNANSGEADNEKCISCMHCISICPENVLKVTKDLTMFFNRLKSHFNLSEEVLDNRRSKYFI